jgi:hypothetical protein
MKAGSVTRRAVLGVAALSVLALATGLTLRVHLAASGHAKSHGDQCPICQIAKVCYERLATEPECPIHDDRGPAQMAERLCDTYVQHIRPKAFDPRPPPDPMEPATIAV